ncbi:MAG TPA: hypothetical protein VFH99_03965 [Candidatus Saccharimonadales bacterium]|nr:hypothetical protein [Candidatus Saccharimonadales bacterium]
MFVSQSNVRKNRRFFGPILVIAVIATLAFVSQASASGKAQINVLIHYGVPGLTTGDPGNQSQVNTANGFKPSGKVGKIVKVKQGVKLRLVKGEKIAKVGYNYVAKSTGNVSMGKWNGKGVLRLKRKSIRITDVFVWAKIPDHPPYITVTL